MNEEYPEDIICHCCQRSWHCYGETGAAQCQTCKNWFCGWEDCPEMHIWDNPEDICKACCVNIKHEHPTN